MPSHLVTLASQISNSAVTGRPVRLSNAGLLNGLSRQPGVGSALFHSGAPVLLGIEREAFTVAGALTIWGADAQNPEGNPNQQNSGNPLAQIFKGDGSTTAFQTSIAYVAKSNNNWIATCRGYVLSGTAAVTAGSTTVTGTSTKFTTETAVGELIQINGQILRIAQIYSDTSLDADAVASATASSQNILSMGHPLNTSQITVTSGVNAQAIVTFTTAPPANADINIYQVTPVQIYPLTGGNGLDRLLTLQTRSYDFMWWQLAASPSAASVYVYPAATN